MKSYLIRNAQPSPETISRLRAEARIAPEAEVVLSVMEVHHKGSVYYCALAGGELRQGKPFVSEVGDAAIEALVLLPVGSKQEVVVRELRLGKRSLVDKIKETLDAVPPRSRVVFIGDMAGELDGKMFPSFNLQKELVTVTPIH